MSFVFKEIYIFGHQIFIKIQKKCELEGGLPNKLKYGKYGMSLEAHSFSSIIRSKKKNIFETWGN